MLILFEKKAECENPSLCFRNFIKKVEEFLPEFQNGENGHMSISIDELGNHRIFLFLYDQGRHESMFHEKLIIGHEYPQYNGKAPDVKEIKSLIH